MNRSYSGFTIIELLVVVAIIAIIAVGAFVALNPTKRLGDSNDARRKADLISLARAIELYTADYGTAPSQLVSAAIQAGQKYVLCSSASTLSCNGQSNSCRVVTDSNFIGPYLSSLPIDPAKTATTDTGYYITRSNTNTLVLGACTPYSSSAVEVAARVNLPTYVASNSCGDGSVGGAEVCDYTSTACPNNASYRYTGFVYDGSTCTSSKYACSTSCDACITKAACLGTCDSGGVYSGGYCWYLAPDDATACSTVCTNHSTTCTNSTWNDSGTCTIAGSLGISCSSCNSVASNKAPYYDSGTSACYYRASGSGACTGTVGIPGFNRICACNG